MALTFEQVERYISVGDPDTILDQLMIQAILGNKVLFHQMAQTNGSQTYRLQGDVYKDSQSGENLVHGKNDGYGHELAPPPPPSGVSIGAERDIDPYGDDYFE